MTTFGTNLHSPTWRICAVCSFGKDLQIKIWRGEGRRFWRPVRLRMASWRGSHRGIEGHNDEEILAGRRVLQRAGGGAPFGADLPRRACRGSAFRLLS